MNADWNKQEKLFGRTFNNYAKHITRNSEVTSYTARYNFINVTNNNRIEYRLNKFKNAKQYQTLIKFEAEVTKAIVKNFCEHFNDTDIDINRYYKKINNQKVISMTAYRKHKAEVTAKKIVKLYEKYTDML